MAHCSSCQTAETKDDQAKTLDALSEAFADQTITEQECILISLNHELTISNDLFL